MKLKLLLFAFGNLFLSNSAYCQNYKAIDSIVDSYPKQIANPDILGRLIIKDFSAQADKVRAIYRWVTTNIEYDVVLAESMDSKSLNAFSYKTEQEKQKKEVLFKSEIVYKALSSRKTVCHGYAFLVEALSLNVGIEAKTITGILKSSPNQIGQLPTEINHAWNVVKVNDKWHFIDATLGAGYVTPKNNSFKFDFNESFFLMPPDDFFKNHFPNEEKWLLTSKSKTDFANLPLFFGNYFREKYEIKPSDLGICSNSKTPDFLFALTGLSESDYVQYAFDTEKKSEVLELDNSTIYSISLAERMDNILSIFVNGKIIVMYKIQP